MRVLIVEDEHKIANALKRALEQENYAVDVSYDGDDGYAMATTEPYDVAIIDRMLPGEHTGIDIVQAMREAKIHTPILLLTALGSISDKTKGLDSGADDYLVKPFALEELLARVRALVRRPAETHGTTLQVGDLTLNTVDTTILVGLIVLIGISRVYLGAHFPSDVIAGWLLGSIALLVVIFVIKPLTGK